MEQADQQPHWLVLSGLVHARQKRVWCPPIFLGSTSGPPTRPTFSMAAVAVGMPGIGDDLAALRMQREELARALDFTLAQHLAMEDVCAADEGLAQQVELLKWELNELAARESRKCVMRL